MHSLLLISATAWCLVILAAPMSHLPPVYEFFALICHQDPDRSWRLLGQPLPVCIRCASLYFGFWASLVARLPLNVQWLRWSIVLGILEIILAWTLQDLPVLRCLTGIAAGAAVAPFVQQGVSEMWRTRRASV